MTVGLPVGLQGIRFDHVDIDHEDPWLELGRAVLRQALLDCSDKSERIAQAARDWLLSDDCKMLLDLTDLDIWIDRNLLERHIADPRRPRLSLSNGRRRNFCSRN